MTVLDAGWFLCSVLLALVLTAGILQAAEHQWPALTRFLDRYFGQPGPWEQ